MLSLPTLAPVTIISLMIVNIDNNNVTTNTVIEIIANTFYRTTSTFSTILKQSKI